MHRSRAQWSRLPAFALLSEAGAAPHTEQSKSQTMKWFTASTLAIVIALTALATLPSLSGHADDEASPVSGIKIPTGYREWRLISVAHEEGSLSDLRAILGNDVAINASREERLPFPDGAIIARLAWNYAPLQESFQAFGQLQSYVAGPPKNGVQFMVKDSSKYASTGGWGYAQFNDGQPAAAAVQNSCLPCHQIVKAHDFVFNHYSP